MGRLVLTTYDWAPEMPRGYVRDLRVRWALEEAGLHYTVATTPFRDRGDGHFSLQPFGQVPWLTDGDLTIFESGAILLHLGGLSGALMPADAAGRSVVTQWVFAALNSVEMASFPWFLLKLDPASAGTPGLQRLDAFLASRLDRMEPLLERREWLTNRFSIADILMADVFRLVDRFDALAAHPACRAYVARAEARPAFKKSHADQMALFALAD